MENICRADQMAAHQMYGQTGGTTEPQIDQNMHNRNYYSTRYSYYCCLICSYVCTYKSTFVRNENICI